MGHASTSGHAERLGTYPLVRATEGQQTNPTDGTLMADSGQLSVSEGGVGTYEVIASYSIAGSAAGWFTVQHRNAANDATLGVAHSYVCGFNNTTAVPLRIELTAESERIRIVAGAGGSDDLTGTAAATLTVQRIG